jgi:hypothetical protein
MIVNVKIFYYSVFGKGILSLEFQRDEISIMDVLSRIETDYGEAFESQSGRKLIESFGTYFNVFLNGAHILLPEQSGIKISDHDTLIILHPVRGG